VRTLFFNLWRSSHVMFVTLDTEGQLALTPDNQPAYRLAPQEGRRSRIVELEGFFRTDSREPPSGPQGAGTRCRRGAISGRWKFERELPLGFEGAHENLRCQIDCRATDWLT
jgi:hypothetical protein